jgi:hypothetical protein
LTKGNPVLCLTKFKNEQNINHRKNEMKTKTKKVVGRGRPVSIQWHKANLLWKSKTSEELALMLGCTPARVSQKRKELAEKAYEEGKDPSKYESRRKWARTLQPA